LQEEAGPWLEAFCALRDQASEETDLARPNGVTAFRIAGPERN